MKLYQKLFAEFLGTFVLVLFGTGVAVTTGHLGGLNILFTALAFGLSVVVMANAVGHVSGGHFNPAVSLAAFLEKRITGIEFLYYVVSQLVGALLASTMVLVIVGSNSNLGSNLVSTALPNTGFAELLVGLLVEVFLTFIFITVILQVTSKEKSSVVSGLIIGLTLTLIIIFGFQLTGLGVNPARSLAPAILQAGKALEQVWIFIVGPLIGGYLAHLVQKILK
ncbi:aquaporin Z [Acholeplasma morum]|uniref:MIP/aquaporin family protein n=1 Tax=Paracholeplasma morum TaxID=264637 RepID=UPI00195B35A7|nr:aquaporin [Paracholeplasma morum]MBM7452748.1 aquaporin Z [Paracholeplasma morum]